MKRLLLILILLVIFIPTLVLADFRPADWPLRKSILDPQVGGSGYVRLPLDNDISATDVNFRDVRIVSDGVDHPYQLVTQSASSEKSYYDSSLINKVVDNAGRTVFILDLGQSGKLSNSLIIQSATTNYQRYVQIYVSDNFLPITSQGWNKLTDQGYIVKFTDSKTGLSAGQDVVNYPDNSSRYFKVVIDSGQEGPIDVTNASVLQYSISRVEESVGTYTGVISQNVKERSTEFVLDLGRQGIPSHRIELGVSSNNFSRQVVVQSSADSKTWQRVGEGAIFRVDMDKFKGAKNTIDFPETTSRYLRVIIFNQDDQPLEISPTVKIFGVTRNIVFLVVPGKSYYVYYGNKNAIAPQYDLSQLFSYLDLGKLKSVKVGQEEANPDYIAPKLPGKTFFESYPYLLDILFGLVVVSICFFLFLYVRSYRKERAADDIETPVLPPTP